MAAGAEERSKPMEVSVSASEASTIWETLSQNQETCRDNKAATVRRILASLELPFLRKSPKPPAAEKSTSEGLRSKEKDSIGVTADAMRSWADKRIASQSEAAEGEEKGKEVSDPLTTNGLPQSLSSKYRIKKGRQQRPARLDEVCVSKSVAAAPTFDYSAARERLKANKKQGKKRPNAVAESFYAIPDENLVKPGKRRKQPTSGNRSITFK